MGSVKEGRPVLSLARMNAATSFSIALPRDSCRQMDSREKSYLARFNLAAGKPAAREEHLEEIANVKKCDALALCCSP